MVKAFKLPGYEDEKEDDEVDLEEDDIADEESNSNGASETHCDGLPTEHHGCFSHVVKDGFKQASQIDRIINKCSKIVAHVHRSTIATATLEGEKTLKLANATHWNSQLKMIKFILAITSTKLDSLDAPKLTAYEGNIIKEIIEILTPFVEAIDFAQVEDYPAGYVLPCVRGLEHQLSMMVTKYHYSFVLALNRSLTSPKAIYETKNDYIMAAILDPRFKLMKIPAHLNTVKTAATVLGVPASSAAVEQLFNVAGKIFRPER